MIRTKAESSIELVSINVSTDKGTTKTPVSEATVAVDGIVGDAHAGNWGRQVSLLSAESIERFSAESDRSTKPGDFAENLTLRGLDFALIRILDRFRIGNVELEVTQIGKACHGSNCSIFREVGKCVMPTEGVFCRVLSAGRIGLGDAVEYIPRTISCRILTLSDRAYKGEYSDRSGPRILELLEDYCSETNWNLSVESTMLPDSADALRTELTEAKDAGLSVVITTGGTGVGPRDITPDVAAGICDKLIPGIMDHIRLKFGARNPRALLSRSIAGVAGKTLLYTLPGSVRAVEEYMGEILPTLEHLIFTIQGLDTHGSR